MTWPTPRLPFVNTSKASTGHAPDTGRTLLESGQIATAIASIAGSRGFVVPLGLPPLGPARAEPSTANHAGAMDAWQGRAVRPSPPIPWEQASAFDNEESPEVNLAALWEDFVERR